MADDALSCFTSLLESVPGWIADLESILKTSTDRQKDILFEKQPADTSPNRSRKPSKSWSLRSRRSKGDEDKKSTNADQSEPTLLRPQLPHMTQSDALRLVQRKRKTASALSGGQSEPTKFRSRSMVVVYYDGETQKRFEKLVRAIGTCRNSLRKGKMSAKVDKLSRNGSSGSEGSSKEVLTGIGMLNYRSAKRRRKEIHMLGRSDGMETFDKVDKLLEKAQTLCERAAHQVLRDGDCALELRHVKEHFVDAQKLGDAQLPSLRKRAAKSAERQRRGEERRRVVAEENEKKRQPDDSVTETPEDPFSSPASLEVDLEAEDSDGHDNDAGQYTVTPINLSKYGMRSTRLMAQS